MSNVKQWLFLAIVGIVLYFILNFNSLFSNSDVVAPSLQKENQPVRTEQAEISKIESKADTFAEQILAKYGREVSDDFHNKTKGSHNTSLDILQLLTANAYLKLCFVKSYKRSVKSFKVSFDSPSKALVRLTVAVEPNADISPDDLKLFKPHAWDYEFQTVLRKFGEDWELDSFTNIGIPPDRRPLAR